jgi:hypothetical protein
MDTLKTTFISFGASLTASVVTLLIYLHDLKPYQRGLLLFLAIVGILSLAYGTGLLQERIINPSLRKWRKKHPIIAIIDDLVWSVEKRTYAWAWSEMTAEKWRRKLMEEAKTLKIKPKINLIKLNKLKVRFCIERYNLIINPYGSVYPETNIKELSIWNTISSYVLNGGVFVSLADIPFYYAYDIRKEISYELVKPTDHLIPIEYEIIGNKLILRSHILKPIANFSGTPFLSETHVRVYNIEQTQNGKMVSHTLRVKEPSFEKYEIKNVIVNRAFLIGSDDDSVISGNIHSIVQEIKVESQYFTPICYINFGRGRYLVSLLFLEYSLQPVDVKTTVTDLLTSLIFREIGGGRPLKNNASLNPKGRGTQGDRLP